MRKDFLHAARRLLQSPVFSLTAILTIALGIGASTAIFSVTNAVLLRPLPYKDPERLVLPSWRCARGTCSDGTFSADGMFDLRKIATCSRRSRRCSRSGDRFPEDDGTPEQVGFGLVTPNFFRMMGAHMAVGRDFTEADGQPQPPADPAARGAAAQPQAACDCDSELRILAEALWARSERDRQDGERIADRGRGRAGV